MRGVLLAVGAALLTTSCGEGGESSSAAESEIVVPGDGAPWSEVDWLASFRRLRDLDAIIEDSCPPEFAGSRDDHVALVEVVDEWWRQVRHVLPASLGDRYAGMPVVEEFVYSESPPPHATLNAEWVEDRAAAVDALSKAREVTDANDTALLDASEAALDKAMLALGYRETLPWEVLMDPCASTTDIGEVAAPYHNPWGSGAWNSTCDDVESHIDGLGVFTDTFGQACDERQQLREAITAQLWKITTGDLAGCASAILAFENESEPSLALAEIGGRTDLDEARRALMHSVELAMMNAVSVERSKSFRAYAVASLAALPKPPPSEEVVRVLSGERSTFGPESSSWFRRQGGKRYAGRDLTDAEKLDRARKSHDKLIEEAAEYLDAIELVYVDVACPAVSDLLYARAVRELQSERDGWETQLERAVLKLAESRSVLADARALEVKAWWQAFSDLAQKRILFVRAASGD